jgi:glycosyltransferase involved in cell wall biosynthesis
MKVLLIAQHAEPSDGWGTLARTTAIGLTAQGHTVQLLLQKRSPLLRLPQHTGLPAPLAVLGNPLLLIWTVWKILRVCRSQRPDMIHVLTEPYALAFPMLPSFLRHPWILTCCGTYAILPFGKPVTSFLFRRAYEDVDHVLAISTYTQGRVLQEAGRTSRSLLQRLQRKISVYTLGIEWPSLTPQRTQHPTKRILFVGGVKKRKGVMEILNACGALRLQSSLAFRLDIVGSTADREYVQALKHRVQELSLENSVHFRGHVSAVELAQAYADADVFIMLSIPHGMHFEGYGLVFLEANARGVPVLGPSGSGCTDVIADGRSGFLADPGDPSAVAERLREILERGRIDPEACRQWAREHSIERQARETDAIYQTVRCLA